MNKDTWLLFFKPEKHPHTDTEEFLRKSFVHKNYSLLFIFN